jgi:uncharacterized protein YndB with AHSA1/START domain
MTATAQVSRTIPADPDKVWETLTSREGMKAYMMGAEVTTDWNVGSPITMQGEYGGKSFKDTGEVRSFEPARKLAYTHRSGGDPAKEHLVTFELKPQGQATEVVVTQDGGDAAHHAEYEKTWAMMLEGLEKAVGH